MAFDAFRAPVLRNGPVGSTVRRWSCGLLTLCAGAALAQHGTLLQAGFAERWIGPEEVLALRYFVGASDVSALDLTVAATDSFARDINNLGQVALRLPLGGGAHTAAVWQAGAGFTPIGQLDGYNTAANAINDAGVLVGVAGAVGAFGTQAFAWSEADGLVALTSRVDVAGSGAWNVLDATGISESGLIVGRGLAPVPRTVTC